MVFTLLKIKVLYWHRWFHEDPLIFIEPYYRFCIVEKGYLDYQMFITLGKNVFINNFLLKGSLGNSIKNEWLFYGTVAKTPFRTFIFLRLNFLFSLHF